MNRAPPSRLRSDSLKKLSLDKLANPLSPLSPGRSEVPLKRVVDEVLRQLIDLIQMLLLQENSQNYIQFMRRVEEMQEQTEKKLTLLIQQKLDKLEAFRPEPQPTKLKLKRGDANQRLKQQRRNMTQSILSTHRAHASPLREQKSEELIKLRPEDSFEEIPEEPDEKTLVNSAELHSLSARLSDIEQTHSKQFRELIATLERRLELAFEDIKGLTGKHLDFRLRFEQKLESNLEALWNVVTDLRTQVAGLT